MVDRRLITFLAIAACTVPTSLPAQDSVHVVIGERYRAGGIQRAFLGSRYRDTWASEIVLPVLNLTTFAGGLTPERMGGGKQTVSLIFRGNDGRRYSFRLIDKDPTPALPVELRESAADAILQDQISSQHPMGVLIVHALESAAGVVHSPSQPFVMPDDQRLGEFRQQFAGQPGLIAERPGDEVDDNALFGEFDNIDGSNRIFRRVAESQSQRVDSRAFLNARLLDVMMGDWDRHRGQWSWGRLPGERLWQPIPEDRDQVFAGLDGLVPSTAHLYVRQLVGFKPDYPAIYGLHHQARELDRQFLAELSRPAWDSVALALQAKITDRVIEDAVRQLPDPMYEIDGPFLIATLKSRRDQLPQAASELYDLLARHVEVFLTDLADEVRITALSGGAVEVRAGPIGGGEAYFGRVFDPGETEEIRIFMGDEDDLAIVGGAGALGITVRAVGGGGADEIRYDQDVGGVVFYDAGSQSRVSGNAPSRKIRTKRYEPPPRVEDDYNTPPHSGSWTVPRGVLFFSADYGLILRAGASRFGYGFRKDPYATRTSYGGALSTEGRFEAAFGLDFYRENSSQHFSLDIVGSQLGILDFYGFGNDSRAFATSDSSRVRVTTVSVEPRYGFRLGDHADLGIGLRGQFTSSASDENPFVPQPGPGPAVLPLYGMTDFQQAGAFAEFRLDSRNVPGAATRGATLNVRGTYYAAAMDVSEAYGSVHAEGTTYLSAGSGPFEPTLALRAGAAKIWGEFPYFDAAFVGGTKSLRGFDTQRFAGDAALFGSAEMRLALFRLGFLTLGDFGLLGFADAGRVYVDGDSPGGWHDSVGAGVWFSIAGRGNSIVIAVANSDEGDRLHITFGMPF